MSEHVDDQTHDEGFDDDLDSVDEEGPEFEPEPDIVIGEGEKEPGYTPVPNLGEFEGRKVGGLITQLGGTKIDGGQVLHHGDKLVTVTVSTIDDVRHPRKDGVIVRQQVAKPDETWVLGDLEYSTELIRSLRLRAQRADDVAAGRTSMQIRTDASGVVLTAGDLGEEALPAVPSSGPDEVVVVFESGERAFWPDEFFDGVESPKAGDVVHPDACERGSGRIVELLDPVTGETLAAWDPAAAAAEDRSVVEDLEAVRRLRRAEEIVGMTQGPAMTVIAEVDDWDLLATIAELESQGRARTGIKKAVIVQQAKLTAEDAAEGTP